MSTRRRAAALSLLAAVALGAAACSSTSTPTDSKIGLHGTATVDYAGSLTGLVQTSLQPTFTRSTHDPFVGKGEGSTDIAHGILDHELAPGAFVSVGRKAIKLLWPERSHFVLTLGTDPLVVAYSSKSRFATQLDQIRTGRKPLGALFGLMETSGFRLARTSPLADPQGAYFILMFELAEKVLHLPAGTAAKILGTTSSNDIGSSSQIVDEDALPTDIASGTFDAGSDYLTEAKQFHLEYITLPNTLDFADPSELSLYSTVTLNLSTGPFPGDLITLNETYVLPPPGTTRDAPDTTADETFLSFLLSTKGQSLLKKAGYVLQPPVVELAPGFHSAKAALPTPVFNGFERLRGTVEAS
jgi:molybdate/tungstate transport system substrate-binding protein